MGIRLLCGVYSYNFPLYFYQSYSQMQPKSEPKQCQYIYEPIKTVHGETIFKKYIKIKPIGHGSYSKCFLVQNQNSDSTYALKIIPKNKLEILQRQKLFYEIKIHKSLIHDNIVYFDHWYEDERNQYIFMEYCAKGNLDTFIKERMSGISESEIKKIGWQIVSAVKYIHEQNVLHRDLKLCNFYMTQNNQIKLGDFGFACQLANQHDKKRESCGTPNYIAPQAISGYGYSFSSDVWAIGSILYRMKFGFCPFEGINVRQTLQKVKTCNYKFPKNIKISSAFKNLITQIFNLNYDERITAADILNHQFFHDVKIEELSRLSPQKNGNIMKRSASLFSNLFSSKKKKQKELPQRNPRIPTQVSVLYTESQPIIRQGAMKKSNSCETLKQIRQIFKSKSKQKNHTLNTTIQTMPTISSLQRSFYDSHISSQTGRSSYQNMKNSSLKKQQGKDRSTWLNQFVKQKTDNIAQSVSPTYPGPLSKYKNNDLKGNTKTKQLFMKKVLNYLFPFLIQVQKNILVLSYPHHFKQIIPLNQFSHHQTLQKQAVRSVTTVDSSNNSNGLAPNIHNLNQFSYIVQLDESTIYDTPQTRIYKVDKNMVQVTFDQLPKLVAYIIENKIKWNLQPPKKQSKEEQFEQMYFDTMKQDDELTIEKAISKMPINWAITKDGIVLKYEQKNTEILIAKIHSQKYFYVSLNGLSPKPQNLLYSYDPSNDSYDLNEEVGLLRIYMGWVNKTLSKK